MTRKNSLANSIALIAMAGALAFVSAHAEDKGFRAVLLGTQEVPAVSTAAHGGFFMRLSPDGSALHYQLAYAGLEGDVTQAHIHVGQKDVNGGIAAFLCSNLGNGPAGTQPCPAPPASISGIITAADVVGPAGQGVDAGEFDELVRAIRRGVAYANVHSSKFPGGEVRSQLDQVSIPVHQHD